MIGSGLAEHLEGALDEVQRLFFDFLASGRFDVAGLTTHSFPPENAMAAYDLPNHDRGSTVAIAFDWTS